MEAAHSQGALANDPPDRRAVLGRASRDGVPGVVAALNVAKERKGLSYRALAARTAIPSATLQGWLSGRYAPQLSMRSDVEKLVVELELTDGPDAPGGVTASDWWEALRADPGRKKQIPPPYPGMRAYDFSTAGSFVGRDDLVASLQERISRRLSRSEPPLLLVTGRSGVGKSSVVAVSVETMAPPPGRELRKESVVPGHTAIDALERVRTGECDVLIIDHAETLWTSVPPAVRDHLVDRLADLDEERPGAAVVLVLRADAVAPATDVEVLRRALEGSAVVVGPITEDDAARIITDPPDRHGIVVEPGLVEIILRDAGATGAGARPGPGNGPDGDLLVDVLPLLSQTMRALWLHRAAPDRLSVEDYLRNGGLARSVENGAEEAYARLSEAGREQAWPVLREMIRLDAPAPTRRTVPQSMWEDPAAIEVLQVFLPARLLTSDADGITLSHDLLLTAWPRLARWLATAKDWSAARQLLARFATFWDESGRPDDLLASRTAAILLEAHEHGAGTSGTGTLAAEAPYTQVEREFLEESSAAQAAALDAAETENQRLSASRRRFGIVAAAASVLLVLAVIAAGTSLSANRSLATARTVALSGQVALYSEAAAPTMPSEAAQLAVAAFALDDNTTTRKRLLSQTSAPLPRRLLTPVGPGAVSATGDLLAVGGAGGMIQLVTGSTGALRDAFRAPVSNVYALSLVDTGERTLLAVSGEDADSADGTADGCLWDVGGAPRADGTADGCLWEVGGAPRQLGCVTLPAKSDSALVLEDGGALFGTEDGTIQRLALEGDATTVLSPVPGPVAAADPAADGDAGTTAAPPPSGVRGLDTAGGLTVAASYDGSLGVLVDPLGETRYPQVLPLPGMLSVRLSEDGSRYAASTRENSLVLGEITEGEAQEPTASAAFGSWVNEAVFLPDGRVAAVSSDQTLRLIGPDGTEDHRQDYAALPSSVALVGGALATTSVDGLVLVWPRDAFPSVTARGRLF